MDWDRFSRAEEMAETQPEKAVRTYTALLRCAADNDERGLVYMGKAKACLMLRDFAGARQCMDSALEAIRPESPIRDLVELVDVRVRFHAGDRDDAFDRICKLQSRMPEMKTDVDLHLFYQELQLMRAQVLISRGQFAEVIPLLEDLHTLDLDEYNLGLSSLLLGICHFQFQNFSAAESYFEAAHQADLPPPWDEQASQWLEKAQHLKSNPPRPC
jgi:tetratricopeptide (TPR) repeat protein